MVRTGSCAGLLVGARVNVLIKGLEALVTAMRSCGGSLTVQCL